MAKYICNGGVKMYSIGQLFKNSPTDTEPMFKLIKIIRSASGLKYYRVEHLHNDSILILHEEDLIKQQF